MVTSIGAKKSASAPLAEKTKRVARYGHKRSKAVYSTFDKQFEHCSSIKNDIELIENIIKNKARVVSAEKGKPETKIKLSSVQLSGYRRALSEKKYELKLEDKKLKLMQGSYSKVNLINKNAAKYKSKRFNTQIRLSRSAAKRKDELSSVVTKLVQSLESKKDQRIAMLRGTAVTNALKFYNTMLQIVRSELKGKEALDLLKASSSVRSEIFKAVRLKYGYKPKR